MNAEEIKKLERLLPTNSGGTYGEDGSFIEHHYDLNMSEIIDVVDKFSNQRVIEELERISDIADKQGIIALPVIKRINELKQK